MDTRIRPEPAPEERAAILAALELALPPAVDPRGPWWRAGLQESLSVDPAEPDHRVECL